VLRWGALACAVVTAALLGRGTWADSGSFAVIALGVPVIGALLPFVPMGSRRATTVLTYLAGLAVLAWSLLLGLGIGLFLLPTAALLLGAAVTSHPSRERATPKR